MTESRASMHRLESSHPGMEFAEGYPIGNGRIGVMCFGGPARIVFVINHFDLYWRPVATSVMRPGLWSRVRQLFRDGAWEELHRVTSDAFAGWGRRHLGSFQPAAILEIWPELHDGATAFRRYLDLRSGETGMTCRVAGYAMRVTVRACGASPVASIRVVTTRPAGLRARVRLYRPGDDRFEFPSTEARRRSLTLRHGWKEDATGYEVIARFSRGFEPASLSVEPHEAAKLGGHVPTVNHPDASPHAQAQGIIGGFKSLQIRIAVAVAHGAGPSASAILARPSPEGRDAAAVSALKRAAINLPGGAVHDPSSASHYQRLFEIGRCLFTSATFPGGKPVNLQGIWNDRRQPICDSDWHLDLNTQMALWHIPTGNLLEYHEPFFRMVEGLLPGARENARCIFNMRGLALPVATVGRGEGYQYLDCWVGTSGWVLDHFWNHWRYTLDRRFLRDRFYPILREVCRFYLDYLQDEGDRLVIYPSQSPENRLLSRANSFHGKNSTFDLSIVRSVLERTITAARVLAVQDDVAREAAAALPRLAAFPLTRDGRLREMEDYEFTRGHRHFSHLYPVFPAGQIVVEDRFMHRAAVKALEVFRRWPTTGQAEWFMRLGYGAWAGWTYTVMACTYARLGMGDEALSLLRRYSHAFTWPSGLARCFEEYDLGYGIHASPDVGKWIEIDSPLATVAAIQEFLLQSHGGLIRILPAIPRGWGEGSFRGLRAEEGFEIDAEWTSRRARKVTILSQLGRPCLIKGRWRVRGPGAEALPAPRGCTRFSTRRGARYIIAPE